MLESTAGIWLVVGTALVILEFVVPGVILIFFGIGAWALVPIVFFFDIPFVWQLIVFLVASVSSLFLLRKWTMQKLHRLTKKDTGNNEVLREYIGRTALVYKAIDSSEGSIAFRGSYWQARTRKTEERIAIRQRVRIVDVETATFIVERI